jgi:septum formation protein
MSIAGIEYITVVSHAAEDPDDPVGNADRKLEAVAADVGAAGSIVAADTVVRHGSQLLGKPADHTDAISMLTSMSAKRVEVVSALAVRHRGIVRRSIDVTGLRLRALEEAEIAAYVATGAGDDKAGALEVQGAAARFVERIEGCFANVLGLPLATTAEFLARSTGNPCLTSRARPCRLCNVDWPRRDWKGGQPSAGDAVN